MCESGTYTMTAFTFFPMDGDAISPCSSLLVIVRRRERNSSDSLGSMILDPHCVSMQFVSGPSPSINVCLQAAADFQSQLEGATNQSHSALSRYRKYGGKLDLEHAIKQFERALDTCPLDHPCRAAAQSNLALANFIRCQFNGTDPFLDPRLTLHRNALAARPVGRLDRPSTLIQLAAVHLARLEKRRDEVDTAQAKALMHEVMNLSSAERYELRVAILMFQLHAVYTMDSVQVGDQLSAEHDSISGVTDLIPWISSIQLLLRFKRLRDLADLQQAISILEASVRDISVWDHRYLVGLASLGMAFRYRFEHLGELSDLEQAILKFGNIVDLIPDGHPNKPVCLNNLGISLRARFQRLGDLGDLEQAISRLEDAVDLTPHDNPCKPGHLNNLGNAFRSRFERLGKLSDLEQAISRHRDAVDLTPHGHLHKPTCLNNLGASFLTRFERLGELSDLEQGISRLGDAVDLTPDGHPDKPVRLNNLGNSLKTRFKCLGRLSDLEQAILRQTDAVDLTPHGHLHKPGLLNNLATSLFTRFEHLGKLSDLEETISRLEGAIDLIPDGHPDKPTYLNNLGSSLQTRFECLGKPDDLKQALSLQTDAIDLTPDGHPDRPGHLSNLGNTFLARFRHLGEISDLEQAVSRYSRAACASIGPTTIRFHASQAWISCARTLGHHSLLHAYSVAIDLLPHLAWIGLSLAHRYRELIQGTDVVREAAAAAVDLGQLETAVEWLEQGRSIVWGELFQLRSSYDELSCAYPDHACRLRELSTALEHASATREKSLSSLSEHAQNAKHRGVESLEQEADRHRTIAIDRDKLLQDIRGFPGFERFLLHKEFSQLRASAHSGPVVILNAAESRCDALMVLTDVEDVIHVPLPNFSLRWCKGLQKTLKSLLGPARIIRCDERTGRSVSRRQVGWESLLSDLWNGVVKPVLDALGFSVRTSCYLSS